MQTVTQIDGMLPAGYASRYRTSNLAPVGKRFGYHPERHNHMLYSAVAENLRGGKTAAFPLGHRHHDCPSGIKFSFEKIDWIVLFPEPSSKSSDVTICAKGPVKDDVVLRAAHVFSDLFVTEYRRFYSDAIQQSKKRNGIV